MHNVDLKWLIIWVTVVGNFISMLDSTTINIALYEISKSLNEPITAVQWVVVSYMLILTVFLPFFGKLSEVCPRNKLYASGFLIFSLGAFFSFLSHNLPMLVTSRCIEAFGASILVSNAISIIASMFKGQNRGKALGMNGAIVAFGSMSGPALAGVLINYFGWNTVFLPGCVVAFIASILSYRLIPSYHPPVENNKFDYKGFLYFTIFLFSLLTTITQGHVWGWSSEKIKILAVLFIISTILFVIRELRISYPLIDFNLFKIKSFTLGNIALNLSYWGVFGIGITFPLYAQKVIALTPMTTGFIVLTFSLSLIFTAPIAGTLAGKYGSKYLTLAGGIMFTLALILFSMFNTSTPIWKMVIAELMMGIGNGLFQSPSNMGVLSKVDTKHLGVAGGTLALARNTGMIMGIAVAINILEILLSYFTLNNVLNPFLTAYQYTIRILACFAVLCTSVAFLAYKDEN